MRLKSAEAANIFRLHMLRDGGGLDVFDVAAARVERFNFGRVDVQAEHIHSRTRELQRQRQTDVSETDNGYLHRWFVCIR